MQKTKFLRYLGTLSPDEFRRFGIFLDSPFHQTNKRVRKLCQYTGRYFPKLDSPGLSKAKVWAHLFPGEAYDDNRLRQLIFLTCKMLERFVVTLEQQASPPVQAQLLTKALGRRGLYDHFSKTVRNAVNGLEKHPLPDAATYRQLHHYHQSLYFHPDTPKFKQGGKILQDSIKYFDQYYLLKKLELACEATNRSVLFGEQYPDPWLERMLDEIDSGTFEIEHPLARLYLDFIRLQRQGEDHPLFTGIKRLFFEIAPHLSQKQRTAIQQSLNNYAARQVNKGNRLYYQELFELAKMALEHSQYTKDHRITYAAFTNIAVMGSVLQEFDWVRQFIDDYQVLLEPRERKAALHLSWAYWHYHQKKYTEVLDHLREIPALPVYGFRVKSLRMRTFYELSLANESFGESVRLEMESFEQYIRREKKIVGGRKESYLNQISLLRKLNKLKSDPNRSSGMLEKLRQEIKNKQPVFAKHWLLEKLDKLLPW